MTNLRIGHGYDVHRLTEGRALILGGVTIPYETGLLGHSDADVLTHAVMDALLGALALGGALGVIAVIVRQELVLAIMGGVFVVETLSVMIQTTYYKRTHGKRIFLMAPIHHHFELKGWSETQVVTRFWIITMILVLVGLATLKIR